MMIASAGCLGEEKKPAPTTSSQPPAKNETLVPLVLHLAADGKVTTTAPNGTTVVRTPTKTTGCGNFGGGGQTCAIWTFTFANNGTVEKFIGKFWVEVSDNSVITQGPNLMTQSQPCKFTVSMRKSGTGTQGTNLGSHCVQGATGPVAKEETGITFDIKPAAVVPVKAGETYTMRLSTYVVTSEQRPVVYVLSGTAKYDSYAEWVTSNTTLKIK